MTYAKLERFEFILKQLDSEGKLLLPILPMPFR